MKKFILYIIYFITGLLVIGFIFRNKLESYFPTENDFRISDTAKVSRIEILSEDSIILTRNETSWIVNGGYPASNIAVSNFLFCFQRMKVKGINSKPDISSGNGLRVKIFEGRKKHFLRFYEIDGIPFMHKEGAGKLFAIEIDGFPDIKPGEVISCDPDHWKDRTLLDLLPGEIKEISVLHPSNPENDFLIKLTDGKPLLFDGRGNEVPETFTDKIKLNFYLSYFTNVFYDYTESIGIQPEQDARWIVRVEDTAGRKFELMIFPLHTIKGEDIFKALVKYNNQPDYKVTRYMVLDLLLQDKDHFLPGKTD